MNPQKNKTILYFIAGLFFFTVLSLLIISRLKIDLVAASNPTIGRIDPYIEIISTYQTLLQRPDLSIEGRSDIEGRLNTIGQAATQRSAGLTATPPVVLPISITPNNVVGFKLPDGIDNHPGFSFRQDVFRVINEWRKTSSDHFYAVFAGYLNNDAQQGAVYVFQPDIGTFNLYLTPERRGSVRVLSESGTTITLESTDGTLFYFDAVNEHFVNSQGTPFPPTPTAVNESPGTPLPYP